MSSRLCQSDQMKKASWLNTVLLLIPGYSLIPARTRSTIAMKINYCGKSVSGLFSILSPYWCQMSVPAYPLTLNQSGSNNTWTVITPVWGFMTKCTVWKTQTSAQGQICIFLMSNFLKKWPDQWLVRKPQTFSLNIIELYTGLGLTFILITIFDRW